LLLLLLLLLLFAIASGIFMKAECKSLKSADDVGRMESK
jgi:hypothetical protein